MDVWDPQKVPGVSLTETQPQSPEQTPKYLTFQRSSFPSQRVEPRWVLWFHIVSHRSIIQLGRKKNKKHVKHDANCAESPRAVEGDGGEPGGCSGLDVPVSPPRRRHVWNQEIKFSSAMFHYRGMKKWSPVIDS